MHRCSLPPPLMTSERGSFARHTGEVRQPQIIAQLLDKGGYPAATQHDLVALRNEILGGPILSLRESAPDTSSWNAIVEAHRGASWLDTGWYFAEAYFYRRLLEAVRYFDRKPWKGRDPFGPVKRGQERLAVAQFAAVWADVAAADDRDAFVAILHSSLWGNRADLSNLCLEAHARGGLGTSEERHNILIDDTATACELMASGLSRVDFVSDNVGMDVLFDLALADFVLEKRWVDRVAFHLKDRPFFVSDAMPADVRLAIDELHKCSDIATRELGRRLTRHLAAERLGLRSDPFWASGLMYRNLPPEIAADLGASDLVILKGDVNYRRLLDDRHWPHTTSIDACTGYFPAPLLALRTLKGEILVGLGPGQAEVLADEDPTWLTNGKRGVVQLAARPSQYVATEAAGAQREGG